MATSSSDEKIAQIQIEIDALKEQVAEVNSLNERVAEVDSLKAHVAEMDVMKKQLAHLMETVKGNHQGSSSSQAKMYWYEED